jgi:hypothetical protein
MALRCLCLPLVVRVSQVKATDVKECGMPDVSQPYRLRLPTEGKPLLLLETPLSPQTRIPPENTYHQTAVVAVTVVKLS